MASRGNGDTIVTCAEQERDAITTTTGGTGSAIKKPRRPLSAYNLFFRDERAKLLNGDSTSYCSENPSLVLSHQQAQTEGGRRRHRKSHGLIGFERLTKLIAAKWRALDEHTRARYHEEGARNLDVYHRGMEVYRRTVEGEEKRQKSKHRKEHKTEKRGRKEGGSKNNKRKAPEGATSVRNEALAILGYERHPPTPSAIAGTTSRRISLSGSDDGVERGHDLQAQVPLPHGRPHPGGAPQPPMPVSPVSQSHELLTNCREEAAAANDWYDPRVLMNFVRAYSDQANLLANPQTQVLQLKEVQPMQQVRQVPQQVPELMPMPMWNHTNACFAPPQVKRRVSLNQCPSPPPTNPAVPPPIKAKVGVVTTASVADMAVDAVIQQHRASSAMPPSDKTVANDASWSPVSAGVTNVNATRAATNDSDGIEKPKMARPKRPLSAYNLFFRRERASLLGQDPDSMSTEDAEYPAGPEKKRRRRHRKTHGKVGFQEMARHVAKKWRELDVETKAEYEDRAAENLQRYWREMDIYKKEWEAYEERQRMREAGVDVVLRTPASRSPPSTPTAPSRQPASSSSTRDVLVMEEPKESPSAPTPMGQQPSSTYGLDLLTAVMEAH